MLGTLIRRGQRDNTPAQLSWPDYLRLYESFGFNGVSYMLPAGGMAAMTARTGFRNPIVQACVVIRALVFGEVRFVWQRIGARNGTNNTFGSQALQILEQPWVKASTADLLTRMEFDASRFGNSYWWVSPQGLVWLDPTTMNIITGDMQGPGGKPCGSTLLGYQTQDKNGQPLETFLPEEIVHYHPLPDPDHPFRGLSWFSSLLPDITADSDFTDFKHSFVRNAATPNLVVNFTANMSQDSFVQFKERMESSHTGPQAAFKTLYVGPGADVKTVGSNFADMELAATQTVGETRLCVAACVPASIVGISEGLKGQTLNTANYAASRRRFSDGTMRPLWRAVCNALQAAVQVPQGARLWYDDSQVQFLQADQQDAAATRQADASTILSLINAGYEGDSIVQAVTTDDMTALKHTGLYSVQLQPPGELGEPGGPATEPTTEPSPNGTAPTPEPAAA